MEINHIIIQFQFVSYLENLHVSLCYRLFVFLKQLLCFLLGILKLLIISTFLGFFNFVQVMLTLLLKLCLILMLFIISLLDKVVHSIILI